MKRISNDTSCDFSDAVFELHPNLPEQVQNTILNLIDEVAQAQLESCEKEHNEVVGEIFEKIGAYYDQDGYSLKERIIMPYKKYQALEEKYL